jgi:hypothetical protein
LLLPHLDYTSKVLRADSSSVARPRRPALTMAIMLRADPQPVNEVECGDAGSMIARTLS